MKTKIKSLPIVLAFCLFITGLFAQSTNTPEAKIRHWTVYLGAGPNLYFNNLVLAKEYVKEFNYSFAARIMWEPEHHLSLGFETGYYRLYTVDFGDLTEARITNIAVPIQLVINMKFLKNFYFNFASGQSIITNKVTKTADGDIEASTVSLGDFAGSLGYHFSTTSRFSYSVETKLYWSSKLDDKNLALLFMVGYKL